MFATNHMNRRTFLQASTAAAAAATFVPLASGQTTAGSGAKTAWPIGCFNRPWTGDKKDWTYDVALDGTKAAGYSITGLLTRTAKEPFAAAEATQEYLDGLKRRIAARGLTVNMAALRTRNDLALDAQIADMRRQIDHAKFLGVEYLLTFGVDKAEHYDNYFGLMRDAAPYAHERGLQLVLKPHGGSSGAAEEILRCIAQVGHPNFRIWFDAGNIIYYTGKDPVEELKPIAKHVTGFCAKDCDKKNGSVWLEFGQGKVDFRAVFLELKNAGFKGPVMVECCAPAESPEAVMAAVRKSREYLENVFANL